MNHPYFYEHPRPSFPEEIKILNKLEEYSKKNLEHLSLKKTKNLNLIFALIIKQCIFNLAFKYRIFF